MGDAKVRNSSANYPTQRAPLPGFLNDNLNYFFTISGISFPTV